MGKIGIGILTFKRSEYYQKVYSNLPFGKFDELVIVNDGTDYYVPLSDNCEEKYHVIYGEKQNGIAWAKNQAIKYLLEKQCDHIFLIEDDVIIKNENVFNVYIETANVFGIHHLNFSKIAGNEKTLKYKYESPSGHSVGFYQNAQGAFSYFNANLIKKLGNFDEGYKNAFEHIDLEYIYAINSVSPPFWYFPDVFNSDEYLTTIEGSDENSTITNKEKYHENVEKSAKHFIEKHGIFTNQIPDVGIKELEKSLQFLEKTYSRKKFVNGDKKLSIIIPYRDRKLALDTLIPVLYKYVEKQVKNFNICVVEQNDNELFNKGLLNNIGVLLNPDSDYYCIHDVDLIPEFSDYSYPKNPTHLSKFCSQFNYQEDPAALMGGVVVFRKEHFFEVNGYPNDYLGWGKEDACLCWRVQNKGFDIYQHPFGRYYSVPHIHRLENILEHECHKNNEIKWKNEMLGINDFTKNGISNINLSNYDIKKLEYNNFIHFKIKK